MPTTLRRVGGAGWSGYLDQFVEHGQAQSCRGSPNKTLDKDNYILLNPPKFVDHNLKLLWW